MSDVRDSKNRGSSEIWLDAGYELLIERGVDSVRVMVLAEKLKLSRTSFYWFFKDRDALLDALIERWRLKNTDNLIKQAGCYAETIVEAILNVFDCWLNIELFDSKFEFAMRGWAQNSAKVAKAIKSADTARIAALQGMYVRFAYEAIAAGARARTLYLSQIGYISCGVAEKLAGRMNRMSQYVEIFSGIAPQQREIDRFFARHGYSATTQSRILDAV